MGHNLDKICPFAGVLHSPPGDRGVPSGDAFRSPSMQGEFILWVNVLNTIVGCHESFPSPGDSGGDKHRECVCALDSGSIFSCVILGKLSVINSVDRY